MTYMPATACRTVLHGVKQRHEDVGPWRSYKHRGGYRTPSRYRDNSRETLRDETFPAWLDYGAIRDRPGIRITSSLPRWALTASFADLFEPSLSDEQFTEAAETWRASHMSPGDRFRIATLREREHAGTRSE